MSFGSCGRSWPSGGWCSVGTSGPVRNQQALFLGFLLVINLVTVSCTQRPEEMLPGTTLDPRSYDPARKAKTPPLVARLGPGELDLLRQMADEFGTTRSALARRLVVKGLVELRDGVV